MKNLIIAALVVLVAIGGSISLYAATRTVETTADVEVRVWQGVPDGALYLSTRPADGTWTTHNTALDMSELSASGRFRQSSFVTVSVPVSVTVVVPDPPPGVEPVPPLTDGDGSRRSRPIAYGERFQAGVLDMQITSVDTDAWPEIRAENFLNDPPPAGKRFVLWTLQVWNQRGSFDEPEVISDYDFDLVGSRGVTYQPFAEGVTCLVTPNSLGGQLFLSGSVVGTICFAVPVDEIGDGLSLRYNAYQSTGGVSVWFDALD